MPIALIAALAGKNRVIGKNGDLPWHFSSDLKFFKQTTLGHTVLMGRKTYQSILNRLGKPLPGRETVVLTRDKSFRDERVKILHALNEIEAGDKEMFVIGGAEVFEQMLPIADRLILTEIEQEFDGDAFFPAIDVNTWKLESDRAEVENGITLRFRNYIRQAA